MLTACNIDKKDRTNRIILGILLLLAVLLHFGPWFYTFLGIIMIVEGIIGWCGIPIVTEKLQAWWRTRQ